MRNTAFSVLLAFLFICGSATADVVDAEAGGFTSVNETTIDATR